MARQRDDGGPYWRVQAVVGWALNTASALAGRLMLDGVDVDALDGVQWYCVMYAAILDHVSGIGSRAEAAAKFDELHEWGTPSRPDLATWGEAESTKASARAMFELAGGAQARP